MDALTKLLRAQGIGDGGSSTELSDTTSAPFAVAASSKKRRLVDIAEAEAGYRDTGDVQPSSQPQMDSSSLPSTTTSGFSLDRILPLATQRHLLNHYITTVAAQFPAMPVSADVGLESLRRQKPTLLRAMLYAASVGNLSVDDQEEVAKALTHELPSRAIGAGEESLELVQAILVVCLWYRAPKSHKSVAAVQLTQLACVSEHTVFDELRFSTLYP